MITGRIDHRILINYRIDPTCLESYLPSGFKPKLVDGYGVGGICQISMSQMRPKGLPKFLGTSSHNMAHRIAVVSAEGEGVYGPRRETSSALNAFVGGKIFPGKYEKANFELSRYQSNFKVCVKGVNGEYLLDIDATLSEEISEQSIFPSLDAASSFFKAGNTGWSDRSDGDGYDTIELVTQ